MPTELSWLKSMSKDESLVIKVQKGNINIKTSITPFWETQRLLSFQCQKISNIYSSLTLWSDSSLWYILWVFSFNLGEGWGGIVCLGRDKGVGKSMEGQSTEVACLTFTHRFFHTEPPQSTDDIEILYRLWVKLCMWKSLAHGDITH